eukprot:5958488-Ditylum_brightwellii.AAC.1
MATPWSHRPGHKHNSKINPLGILLIGANIQGAITWQWLLGQHVPHKHIVDKDNMEHWLPKQHVQHYQQA